MNSITRIIKEGRNLFPINEYGYLSFLKHPGAKITSVGHPEERKLRLTSAVPREYRNGRYYPGWDCIEASHWLKNRLNAEGYNAHYIFLKNPVHRTDYAVEVDEEIMSLTPGIDVNHPLVEKERKIADEEFEKFWRGLAFVNFEITNEMGPLSWEMILGQDYKHNFGIYFPQPDVIEFVLSTSLIRSGAETNNIEATGSTRLKNLELLREWIISHSQQEIIKRFNLRYDLKTTAYHVPLTDIDRKQLYLVNQYMSLNYIPLFIKLLDPKWTQYWESAGRRIFRKVFSFLEEIIPFSDFLKK